MEPVIIEYSTTWMSLESLDTVLKLAKFSSKGLFVSLVLTLRLNWKMDHLERVEKSEVPTTPCGPILTKVIFIFHG